MKCLNIVFATSGGKSYPCYILSADVNPDDVIKQLSEEDSQYSYHFIEVPFWDNYTQQSGSYYDKSCKPI
jgi:hypothetical protein